MIDNLQELKKLLEDGWQLAVTKGMAGCDLSCNVTNLIYEIISEYLEKHER